MKLFSLFFSLNLFSVFAYATEPSPEIAPPALVGSFAYFGQTQIWRQIHSEVIDVRGERDQQKLDDLNSSGYECVMRASHQYVCSIDREPQGSNRFVQNKMDNKYQGLKLDFGPELSSASLVFNGENYKRWSLSQPIEVQVSSEFGSEKLQEKFKVADYDYVGSLLKIYPGGSGAQPSLCVIPIANGNLEIEETVRLQSNRFQIETYFVTVQLERK